MSFLPGWTPSTSNGRSPLRRAAMAGAGRALVLRRWGQRRARWLRRAQRLRWIRWRLAQIRRMAQVLALRRWARRVRQARLPRAAQRGDSGVNSGSAAGTESGVAAGVSGASAAFASSGTEAEAAACGVPVRLPRKRASQPADGSVCDSAGGWVGDSVGASVGDGDGAAATSGAVSFFLRRKKLNM